MTEKAITRQSSAIEILRAVQNPKQLASSFWPELAKGLEHADSLNALLNHYPVHLPQNGAQDKLRGLPISVKDNIALAGYPTTAATPGFAKLTLEQGPILDKLMAQGSVVTCKTNLHELAFGITGANAHTGAVLNPFNQDYLAGGSSSGAAVSVAVGAAAVAVGTDTGGSCRIPAAHCAVVGFRPTTGRYAGKGFVELSPSRDTLGLIARYVNDIALIDSVLCDYTFAPEQLAPSDITLGVVSIDSFGVGCDPEVAALYDSTIKSLDIAKVKIKSVDISNIIKLDEACGFIIAVYETFKSVQRQLAALPELSITDFIQSIASEDVRQLLASQLGDEAIPEALYLKALQDDLPALQKAFDAVYADNNIDALFYPTSLYLPPHKDLGDVIGSGESAIPVFPAYTATTRPDSMAGQPSLSLAAGLANGLPVGIQVVGAKGQDKKVIAIAHALESILPQRPIAS